MLKKILVLMIIAFLFMPFMIDAVSAEQMERPVEMGVGGEDQGPGGPEGGDGQTGREVNLDKYSKRVIMTSSWDEKETRDELRIGFECDKGSPRFDIDYQVEDGSNKTNFSFGVVFEEVFEFKDMNENGRYDKDDEKVNRYVLDGSRFTNIIYEGVQSGYRYRTRTMDSNFSLEARGGGDFMNYGTQTIHPSESKIDIDLDYELSGENTRLGLKISLENHKVKELGSKTYDEEKGYAEGESWVRLQEEEYSGFFSWSDSITIDGKELPVNATFMSQRSIEEGGSMSEKNDTLYLSYPEGGDDFIHDPKIGVVGASAISSPTSGGTGLSTQYLSMVLAATVAVSAGIFGAGVYIRKKY